MQSATLGFGVGGRVNDEFCALRTMVSIKTSTPSIWTENVSICGWKMREFILRICEAALVMMAPIVSGSLLRQVCRDVAAAPQTPQLGGAQANFGGPS